MNLQPVPGRERERLHPGELVAAERRLVLEEKGRLAELAIVGVVADRPVVLREADEPRPVGIVVPGEGEVARIEAAQALELVGDRGVQHQVVHALAGDEDDLRLVRVRVEPGAGDVVVRVFRDQELRPVRAVEPDEPARVGARRRQRQQAATVLGERERMGGQRVLLPDREDRPPRRVGRVADRDLHAAVLGRCDGRAHVEAPVGDETDVARVLHDLRELAARERELEDVVQLRVLPVQADEDPVGEVLVDVLDACLDALERRQVSLLTRLELDVVQPPVLVAAPILEVQDAPVVGAPEELADPPVVVVRHDPIVVGAHRAQPHVQDAFVRREPGQPAAVGRDAGREPLGVSEQDFARNEWDLRRHARTLPIPLHGLSVPGSVARLRAS